MLIIAGLGNPGNNYAANRHNIGFMAADEIVRCHNFAPWKSKFNAEISEGTLDGHKVLVVKPQTFMNKSGEAISKLMRFYKLSPEDLIVLYDELDLAAGKLRIKTGGGAGGHNGIRSIDAHCGKEYRRIRIGIGHPGDKARVTGHVLGDFAKVDSEWLDPMLAAIGENAPLLAKGEDSSFMNRVALATKGDNSDNHAAKKKTGSKAKSHIHQARKPDTGKQLPKSGPMADMLKKLFGGGDT